MPAAMPLSRVLEPEVMDSEDEARDYDAMNHSAVNERFCDDLLANEPRLGRTLDVGTGTAQIPIALCKRAPEARVLALDLAESMLRLGTQNVERAALSGVITLARIDAKSVGTTWGKFDTVMSNSIIHHIPEPRTALAEMLAVLAEGGLLFVRDLARPEDDATVTRFVETYAKDESPRQRALFDASLRAALSIEETRALCASVGIPAECAQMTSDRHFTICYRRPQSPTAAKAS